MFQFFKKKPQFIDQAYADLAIMLVEDEGNPTYKREIIDPVKLNFSIESLHHLDECLEVIHQNPPEGHDFLRLVLRYGAYVGEVIKRNSKKELHWIECKEAAKFSKMASEFEDSISTSGILWQDEETMCFPLGKVCKFIENGNEDSVHLFAKVILKYKNDP